ncbi:hypothetical protein J2Y63_002433 [Shinella sp. BE166]|uniref:hypothetical protein n=1 Tax=Shinella sp. BE166 TaxID=3373918 RepID=UPI003EBCF003
MQLTTAAQELHQLRKELEQHVALSKKREDELRGQIKLHANVLSSAEQGLDIEKVGLAKTVIYVNGSYDRAGQDRASVIQDAVKQLATGDPVRQFYGDLWSHYFGTKNYDRWSGQRSDHQYGYGPGHGSIVFRVGIVEDVRKNRSQADLTAEEIEAAIYYLTNIKRVQDAEADAAKQAAA